MTTAAGRRLTEAHRLAQARLGAMSVMRMRALWPLLDPDDLDGTFPGWLTAAIPLVQGQRSTSARLAASYLGAFKAVEVGFRPFVPVLSETATVAAVTTSLLVTGPISIKRAMVRGVSIDHAADTAESSSAASAMRYVLDGGRDTVMRTLKADRDAVGWQRVASGKACQFCSELDGKFHRDDNADFEAHDGCSCSQEPVYR